MREYMRYTVCMHGQVAEWTNMGFILLLLTWSCSRVKMRMRKGQGVQKSPSSIAHLHRQTCQLQTCKKQQSTDASMVCQQASLRVWNTVHLLDTMHCSMKKWCLLYRHCSWADIELKNQSNPCWISENINRHMSIKTVLAQHAPKQWTLTFPFFFSRIFNSSTDTSWDSRPVTFTIITIVTNACLSTSSPA